MYWGKDNYIGECSVPLSELLVTEEQDNVLQVRDLPCCSCVVKRKVVQNDRAGVFFCRDLFQIEGE